MARNPYLQAFDLRSGEIVELTVGAAGLLYLMTPENLTKYCAGREDYKAEGAMPGVSPIELVAGRAGRWYLVSEHPLEGTYRLRRGLDVRSGSLRMQRSRSQ
jgi:hypothetical protein